MPRVLVEERVLATAQPPFSETVAAHQYSQVPQRLFPTRIHADNLKGTMRKLGVLFLVSVASVFGGGIGPDIGTLGSCDNVAFLSDLTGSAGCAVAPFSIFNASYTPATGSPATSEDDIGVNIGYNGSSLGISFSGLFLFPPDTGTPPGYAEYVIRYTIDPPPPVILGFDMDMEFGDGGSFRVAGPSLQSLLPGGTIEVFTELCVGGDFSRTGCFGSAYGPIVLDDNNSFQGLTFNEPTNWVSVIHRIRVTKDVSLDLNSRAPLGEIPEPGTWALMGSGILLIAWRRRR